MSGALVNAVTKLGKRVEELERITPGEIKAIPSFNLLNQLSEMAARIEELEHRIQILEAKRKPGRPRKDER